METIGQRRGSTLSLSTLIRLCVLGTAVLAFLTWVRYLAYPICDGYLTLPAQPHGGAATTSRRTATGRPNGARRPRRVALCFFGLTRSLTLTIESIQTNLINVIQDAGYEVDVYLHTYSDVDRLRNPRSGEDVALNSTEWKLLDPVATSFTSQAAFLEEYRHEMDSCQEAGLGWPADPPKQRMNNMVNLMCQLNSVREVGKLWHSPDALRQYRAVIYARPDVLYNCPFPTRLIDRIEEGSLYIPDHSHYHGLNDRFAMAAPLTARSYAARLQFSLAMCTTEPINAERYVQLFVDVHGYNAVRIPYFSFFRLRASGEIAYADALLLHGCNATALARFNITERPGWQQPRYKNFPVQQMRQWQQSQRSSRGPRTLHMMPAVSHVDTITVQRGR